MATEYAKAQGGWHDKSDEYYGNGWWWLRSPGSDSYNAAGVSLDGYVSQDATRVDDYYFVVRPALWIAP